MRIIQWNKAEIIHKGENRITRKLNESVFIRMTEQAISQPILDMNSISFPLL